MKRTAALLICAFVLAGCNPQPDHGTARTATPSPAPSGLPPLKITGHGTARQPVRVIGQRPGGGKAYQLLAQSYESHSVQNVTQATFEKTHVTFYDKDGTTLQAQSPQAHLDDRRKQVILAGGVHAKTSTGLTLVCDQLVYDDENGMLHGTGHVRITGMQGGQQQVLTGNEFTSDVKLTRMTMR
jgi:LPS export ABC transporter protein LptC